MSKKLTEMSLEELWQLFPIILTEHQECWKEWYLEEEKKKLKRKMADMMIAAAVLLVFCALLFESNGFGGWIPESSCRNIIGFTLGISTATLVLNVLYLFGILDKVREKKLSLIKKK